MSASPTHTWLIAGLGNPEERYDATFHNLGFRVADLLSDRQGGGRWESLFRGRLRKVRLEGTRAVLLKPMTYMNLSGESVRPAADKLGVPLERIVVVHDDLDLEPGDVRVKVGGGAGGHRGLASCIQHLASPEFIRVRIGIGRHEHVPADRWVLTRIPADQGQTFDEAVERAADAVEMILSRGPALTMNETNRREAESD
ncbi:MAG: aminoacyl-tRNA hydrolase [Deltaproteobacteria bacterium]|nr:aminoacyl-tRNA hydrolase [Deltaproteobacteria bacterium]